MTGTFYFSLTVQWFPFQNVKSSIQVYNPGRCGKRWFCLILLRHRRIKIFRDVMFVENWDFEGSGSNRLHGALFLIRFQRMYVIDNLYFVGRSIFILRLLVWLISESRCHLLSRPLLHVNWHFEYLRYRAYFGRRKIAITCDQNFSGLNNRQKLESKEM